jgi:exo-beta-1,3-glucanase (GH17 family)
MTKMGPRFYRFFCAALIGATANVGFAAGAGAVDCGAPVPAFRASYFSKIGVGADYGPHYPCYDSNGAIAQCYNNDGTRTANLADAKNNEMQASVPLDMSQLQLAGFNSVRAYGDPSKVWIAMINAANAANMQVVYQVAICKSDFALPNHPCVNGSGPFNTLLNYSIRQLHQVVTEVTPAIFQKVVKLVIVGNEDLIISPTDHTSYNTPDLINAINATSAELSADKVAVHSSWAKGVDLSSATVVGQMTTPPGIQLASAFTPGAPVIENIYGAQFSSVKTPADALTFLQNRINALQSQYMTAQRPAMIGETGWWTNGQDANYEAATRVGTLADAKAYFQLLYPYLQACSVPALIFEAYDQATKGPAGLKPNPPGAREAEQKYGVMNAYNTAKDRALLPAPAPGYQDHPETQNAALFTFSPTQDISTAPPMTFGVGRAGQASYTKITVKPLNMVTLTGTTAVWPTFNLTPLSKIYLFRAASDQTDQCRNSVTSIYTTPQQGPLGVVPAYSGGTWYHQGLSALGCLAYTPTNVNWGTGASPSTLAQNVSLAAGFSTNPLQAPWSR